VDHSVKTVLDSGKSDQSRFKDKKVLILGLGLNEGGVGSAKFFASRGADLIITDLRDAKALNPSIEKLSNFPNIKYHLGSHNNEDIDWADIIIKNQAIKPNSPYLKYAREKSKEIKTDIGTFLEYVKPSQIIGITGTKGKTTTASLIFAVLKESGKKVVLCGNIGKSVLDSINDIDDDTTVVMEISSFQLEAFDAVKVAPKYSVITNIYPDHLNYYSSMEDYVQAKKLIAKHQTLEDYLFINKQDETLTSDNFLENIKSKIVFYSPNDLPSDFSPKMEGSYNLSNIAAAFSVSKALRIEQDIILKVLEEFQGVEFRLQLVKEWNGIRIYNNTTATAPEPAIESLKTFPNCILIAGGMNKGLDYKAFAEAIDTYAKDVYFLDGDATTEIINYLKNSASAVTNHHEPFKNLTDLLAVVKKNVKLGDIILFSPGATSFNLFQNEFDRGRKFNQIVEEIFE